MIKNFEETKRQLAELAMVLNSFKSEAVQLRIIELVLQSGAPERRETPPADDQGDASSAARTRRRKAKASVTTPNGGEQVTKGRRRGGVGGPVPTLELLIDEGFFSKHQTIGQIVEHCGSSKARNFKPNEISGPLGRLVRSNKLKRKKNADGQFEYFV
jgi:hypothetical protein